MKNENYELYFDSLLKNMLEGVAIHQIIFDENGIPIDYIILKINDAYKDILGYDNKIEGKLASEIYDDIPALDLYSSVVLNKKPSNVEFYYEPMNRYFNVSVAPWNDVGFITIFSDITDRIEAQENLKNINEFNQNLINTIPYEMEIIDSDGNILFTNKLMELKHGNIIGKKCWNTHTESGEKCKMCPLLSNIKIGETSIVETDFNNKIYEITHTGIKFQGGVALLEIFQDITDRKQSENRLERAEIISQTGNWELYLDTNTIVASDGAKKIYGFDVNNIKEWSLEKISSFRLPEYKKSVDDAMINLITDNIPYDVEFKINVNSEIKDVRSIATHDKKNNVVFGVIQDITIQKKNEEELEKSNAIKSVFLSNISHELRTPMNSIIGFSDILLEKQETKNTEYYRFLRSINSNAKHLDELLNNILDYSKLESSEFDILYEKFYIDDLFDDLCEMFDDVNNRKNLGLVKLEFIRKKNNRKIICDYLRLKQILFNIISNSIKFTEKGHIKISYFILGEFITFKVEDTGIGISKKKIKYIFDRFWQGDSTSRKKYKGTGLGLSISKSITDLLSGDISVKSVYGKGTTFFVKIPLDEIKKEEVKYSQVEIDYSDKCVLIVDEIPVNYSLLGMYMNSINVKVVSCNSSNIAIKKYNKQKDKIDIIFIDLPDSDLINKLKEINKDCVIVSKSVVDEENKLIDYHLEKPIDKNKLLLILNKIWLK